MNLLADLTLSPGGILAWLGVGLIAGWLAGAATSGSGFGIVGDIVIGLIGAVVGGLLTGFVVEGEVGFWGSIIVAFLGAIVLIGIARVVVPRRHARRF